MLRRYLAAILAAWAFSATTTWSAVKVEKTDYKDWMNCYRLSNDEVELIVTAGVGPRIIRYGFVGGQNVFKEMPEPLTIGDKTIYLYGGHRLWVGPEDPKVTYSVDNRPVEIHIDGKKIRATAPVEPDTKIQKEIEVTLAPSGSEVEVRHRITNKNVWPTRFAPWALTMLAPGGVGVAKFPPRASQAENLLPTHPLVLWAYTELTDERWIVLNKYVVLRQDPNQSDPQKLGLFDPNTRAAYLLGSDLFVKKYTAKKEAEYPDFHCSFETYTNDKFLEIETLGPLVTLQPGDSTEHVERWSLHKNIEIRDWTDAELDRVLTPFFE